ncbi:hypothetical protein CAI21_17720 [Alkalilimnicola ehrlichii]|uniref:DUF2383 domain-containing protein n=1 Tax=Alkalilimnicola ehrlichii TaxID=351052 RepID=A0A3E0WJR5_9GAMM|nr:hypothetical protein [Alkalilimnicola ehrlichii]RFA26168.1 hypothetical protein CAI21_17720 [Alkalilimnicola ehrlichii]RFA32337.1 hypothetical protein CAL65_19825 [Alkalilimnicola ehrlichii]
MFRSEAQVAVDDLQLGHHHAAALYEEDADMIGDPLRAGLFKELAEQRSRMGERLAQHLKRLGELPSGPDEDRETLSYLKDMIQARISDDEYRTLLENRLATEQELARLVRHAQFIAGELPPATVRVIEEAARQVELAQQRLQRALGTL